MIRVGSLLFILWYVLATGIIAAAQAPKPLTNADVIELVRSGLPESTVIVAIQASPIAFDITPPHLIELQRAGASAKVMDAMIAETKRRAPATMTGARPAGPRGAANVAATAVTPISVALLIGDARQTIAVERAQLVVTKTKPTSMNALSKDKILDQALRTGVNTAVAEGMMRAGGGVAGSAIAQAGGIFGGGLSRSNRGRDEITHVWAVAGLESATSTSSGQMSVDVNFAPSPGLNPDEYTPVILKLTPTRQWRLVGATQGKLQDTSSVVMDWPMYSAFVEDRVPVQTSKVAAGQWRLTAAPLQPGDYGLVLRPASKSKKFSGRDVARNQGDGMVFNSVWSFEVK